MADLKIGQVASSVGVGIDTIRYYERLGLLPKAPRRSSGYRVFDERTVERIKLVRQLQDLGLTLEEIGGMLRSIGEEAADCAHESERIRAALARTDEKIAALNAIREGLSVALDRCASGHCTIVDHIAKVVSASKSATFPARVRRWPAARPR